MLLPLVLYSVLLSLSLFAPMRWALVSYLMLSAVDFNTGNSGVGIFNATKGLVCPVVMLWRLRDFGGHGRIVTAPIAWILLTIYAAIASIWSLFPLSAVKLVGEMAGSFLICMAFLRAANGGFLTPKIALPVTFGVIGIAILRTAYIHFAGDVFKNVAGDTPDRFTAFITAQAFASLLTALFAVTITTRSLRPLIRGALCLTIFVALILDGSRLWLIALLAASFLALIISSVPSWAKIIAVGAALLTVIGIVAAQQAIIDVLQGAHQYRIAAAITAAYSGNENDTGLGTVVLRRQLDARAVSMISEGSVLQLLFGHGTSNGRMVQGQLNKGIGDPNRSVHNEWLRITYEWGIVGIVLWLLFIGSLMLYAYSGLRRGTSFAKPLFLYVPAFCIGVSGENIIGARATRKTSGSSWLSVSLPSPIAPRFPLPLLSAMRILQVHNFYREPGGEDIVLANEEKLLIRRGHEVFQYLLHNDAIPDMPKLQVAGRMFWNTAAHRAVRQRIQKHGIQILHVHNNFPLMSPSVYYAAHAEKIPVVQTLHNFRLACPAATFFRKGAPCEDCLEKPFPWPAIVHGCYRHSIPASGLTALMLATHRIAETYSSKVSAYIAFNRFSTEKFIAAGLPAERIHIKPNFVLDDPGLGSGLGNYALFAGRLATEKGVRTLLNAYAQLGETHQLKIAGNGDLRPEVEAFAQAHSNVEYLGQCSRPHLNQLMRNAAFLVFPSEWYEGSPLSVLEAMACGTPVLASNRGSLPEMIQPGVNGLLFPAADVAALIAAISAPQAWSDMRYTTRQYFESHFAAAANYETLLSIYQSVLGAN